MSFIELSKKMSTLTLQLVSLIPCVPNDFKIRNYPLDKKKMVSDAKNLTGILYNTSPNLSIPANQNRVMCFNIRYRTVEDDNANNWGNRLPIILRLINDYNPDIICIQEGLPTQICDLNKGLSLLGLNYKCIGRERSNNWFDPDEMNPIFYKSNLKLISHKTIGLNNKRKIGLSIEDTLPRIVTYGKFRTKDNRELIVFNTHLEHFDYIVRNIQAEILKNIIIEIINNQSIETIITGDLNSGPASTPVNIIKDIDSNIIHSNITKNTFHNFGTRATILDHMFYIPNKETMSIINSDVISMYKDSHEIYPSDHRPLYIDI